MVNIVRGDIVFIELIKKVGCEQRGLRPCLVIQNDLGNKHSPTTIIAPLTSKKYSKEFPTNVSLSKKDFHLKKDSTVLLNQITTIDKTRIKKKICELDKITMDKVDMAIKVSLGIK